MIILHKVFTFALFFQMWQFRMIIALACCLSWAIELRWLGLECLRSRVNERRHFLQIWLYFLNRPFKVIFRFASLLLRFIVLCSNVITSLGIKYFVMLPFFIS